MSPPPPRAPGVPHPPGAAARIATVASVALALVWLAAAVLKALDPGGFAQQIRLHRMVPDAWSLPLAAGLIVTEALLAFALLTGFRRRLASAGSVVLLIFFIGITAVAWSRDAALDCGCFGRLGARGPAATILEDAGFVALAVIALLAGARTPRPAPGTARRARVRFAALLPLAILLPGIGPLLPADALVTDLRVGTDLTRLPIENLSTPLRQGTVVLAIVSDRCAPCDAALPALNAIARGGGAMSAGGDDVVRDSHPTVVGVFAGDRSRAQQWILAKLPRFEVGDAPETVLRRYYRRLPRVALLRDGVVRAVWNRAPTQAEVAESGS